MSRIKCESCGKIYTYQDNEFCPKCGAYNPQKNRKNYILQESVYDETEITMDTEEVEFDEEEPKAQPGELEKFLRDAAHLVGRDDPEAMCQEQGVDMEALNNMTQKQVKFASKVVKLFSEWIDILSPLALR